jgi:hypothetical protein
MAKVSIAVSRPVRWSFWLKGRLLRRYLGVTQSPRGSNVFALSDELFFMLAAAFEAYLVVRGRLKQGARPGRALRDLVLWQSEIIPDALMTAHGVDGRIALTIAVFRFEAVSGARTRGDIDVSELARRFVRGLLATETGQYWGSVCEHLQRTRSLLHH